MLIVMPLFGLWPSPWVLALLPILLIAGILFAAFGLIMTALAKNYEFFNYFISLVITPLFLFSGIFFSLDSLPATTGIFLRYVPLTPVVSLSRIFSYGNFDESWFLKLMSISLLAAASSLVAAILLRRRLIS